MPSDNKYSMKRW